MGRQLSALRKITCGLETPDGYAGEPNHSRQLLGVQKDFGGRRIHGITKPIFSACRKGKRLRQDNGRKRSRVRGTFLGLRRPRSSYTAPKRREFSCSEVISAGFCQSGGRSVLHIVPNLLCERTAFEQAWLEEPTEDAGYAVHQFLWGLGWATVMPLARKRTYYIR